MPEEITEVEGIERHIHSKLDHADLEAEIGENKAFREQAPQGTARPYVIYGIAPSSPGDRNMPGPVRAFTRLDVLVKVVTEGDNLRKSRKVMAIVDRLLRNTTGKQENVRIQGFYRRPGSPVSYPETTPQGVRLNHFGFTYRAFAYSTAD